MGTTTEDLRARLAAERSDVGHDLDAIGDRLSPGRMMQRRRAAVGRRAADMKERVMGVASEAKTSMQDAAGAATAPAEALSDNIREIPEAARRTAEGNPLAVGLVAFGAGLVIAALLPETRRETELAEKLQPALEETAGTLGQTVQQSVESIKPVARDAVAEVKQHAEASAGAVKDQAQEAAKKAAEQR
jgi:gas vesicle protein